MRSKRLLATRLSGFFNSLSAKFINEDFPDPHEPSTPITNPSEIPRSKVFDNCSAIIRSRSLSSLSLVIGVSAIGVSLSIADFNLIKMTILIK